MYNYNHCTFTHSFKCLMSKSNRLKSTLQIWTRRCIVQSVTFTQGICELPSSYLLLQVQSTRRQMHARNYIFYGYANGGCNSTVQYKVSDLVRMRCTYVLNHLLSDLCFPTELPLAFPSQGYYICTIMLAVFRDWAISLSAISFSRAFCIIIPHTVSQAVWEDSISSVEQIGRGFSSFTETDTMTD